MGTLAQLPRELSFFFVADIAGWGSDEAGNLVFFGIFGHIEAY